MQAKLQWRTVATAAIQTAVLAALAMAFFVRAPVVSGLSMAPRIGSGEIVLINTFAYRLGSPHRGDIVAFHHDGPTPAVFIKRIVGLPGDRIAIHRGIVTVNGETLREPYVRFDDGHSFAPVVVPAHALYVLGDNRADSDDSRYWGFVPENRLIGKAVAAVWPLRNVGML